VDRLRFDIELFDDEDPFEIDCQRIHLAKHMRLDADDVREVWASHPLFYPAHPDGPADWLMVAEIPGTVLVVALAPVSTWRKCRPVAVYEAGPELVRRYRQDR